MSPIKYILAILLAAIYVCFGYFLDRSNFTHLLILFGSAFAIYFFLIFTTQDKKESEILLWISMGFRVIFIVAIPFLSDDFYRFIWDGKLFINGFNPYLFVPSEIVNTDMAKTAGLTQELYQGLNSPDYYSVYPPVNQLLFSLGGLFSKFGLLGGIIALRVPIIIAEFFLIKYIRHLLESLKLSQHNVLWYALNPLVIVELSGNLHYEGMMMMCIVIGLYWLIHNKWGGAAVWWAMAISIKLIPVLFLPILLKRLGIVKSFWFYLITSSALLFTFLPFLDQQLIYHISSSIDLYFRTFEFNASIYYLVRWFGFKNVGYNIIQTAGPILSIITFVSSSKTAFTSTNVSFTPFIIGILYGSTIVKSFIFIFVLLTGVFVFVFSFLGGLFLLLLKLLFLPILLLGSFAQLWDSG